jgi:hypothetical protein
VFFFKLILIELSWKRKVEMILKFSKKYTCIN